MPTKHKTIKHYHEPGDCHELTFSCYQQLPLLTNDEWRKTLCVAIDRAMLRHDFRLVAFVLMPEHVHLLVYPLIHTDGGVASAIPPMATELHVDDLLFAIKRPHSYRIKQLLVEQDSPLLQKLTVRERPGKTSFRFWQEGPGYDRNFSGERAILSAIDYIHNNPVRRGLVKYARDWKWSSACWYANEGQIIDSELPMIHGLPPDFFV